MYRDALDLVEALERIVLRIPYHRADLRDQLRRASTSVALNLAEGASEYAPLEKARFYRMARRSAAECMAILDMIERLHPAVAVPDETMRAVARMGAILTTMIRRAEERATALRSKASVRDAGPPRAPVAPPQALASPHEP